MRSSVARACGIGILLLSFLCGTALAQKKTRRPAAKKRPVPTAPALPSEPGTAASSSTANSFTLSNNWLSVSWTADGGVVRPLALTNKLNRQTVTLPPALFMLTFAGGNTLISNDFHLTSPPRAVLLQGNLDSSRLGDRFDGRAYVFELDNADKSLHVSIRVILRDGAAYIRQELTLESRTAALAPFDITLFDWTLPGSTLGGSVEASPVVADTVFYALESPFAKCSVDSGHGLCTLLHPVPLDKGQSVSLAGAIGIASTGQMRRSFASYVQRERVHPYRQFLEWNTRFEPTVSGRYDEKSFLASINTVGTQLVKKNSTPVSAFTLWDGWDDPVTPWRVNAGFPKGLGGVKQTVTQYGSMSGIWFSPRGGDGKSLVLRLAAASKPGLEVKNGGFVLAGTHYFTLLRDAALKAQKDGGAAFYALDSLGGKAPAIDGSFFESDYAASSSILSELRANNSELFVALTKQVAPSPFWLWQADSVDNGSSTTGFLGEGSPRQQWITFRDAKSYATFVQPEPLFPLNAVSSPVVLSRSIKGLDTPSSADFNAEVWTLFASGQSLQELAVSPALMGDAEWQTIASAASWARDNSILLTDMRWLGGDPAKGEVYGWCGWVPAKGVLVLRNPAGHAQNISFDLGAAFELPAGVPKSFTLKPVLNNDSKVLLRSVKAGTPLTLSLQPFDVLVLEALPVAK